MRQIPYRGKQGREHGEWEFLQRSEIPGEYILDVTAGRQERIAKDMHLELMNQDKQECTNIVGVMGEEAYFKMWEEIKRKEKFLSWQKVLMMPSGTEKHAMLMYVQFRQQSGCDDSRELQDLFMAYYTMMTSYSEDTGIKQKSAPRALWKTEWRTEDAKMMKAMVAFLLDHGVKPEMMCVGKVNSEWLLYCVRQLHIPEDLTEWGIGETA